MSQGGLEIETGADLEPRCQGGLQGRAALDGGQHGVLVGSQIDHLHFQGRAQQQ